MVYGSSINGGLEKARTELYKVYNNTGSSKDEYGDYPSTDTREQRPIRYNEETEDGFVGLEPPMG